MILKLNESLENYKLLYKELNTLIPCMMLIEKDSKGISPKKLQIQEIYLLDFEESLVKIWQKHEENYIL